MPILEINLRKIRHNAKILKNLLAQRNVSIIGITKLVLGNPTIAMMLVQGGIEYLGDSRIHNIIKMKKNNIRAQFVLIRIPSITEIPLVVKYANYSLNSELKTIRMLSNEAVKQKKIHSIILMVDMGDLREGINIFNIECFVEEILRLKNINLSGIGTNFKCFGGIIPTDENMNEFSKLVFRIKDKFELELEFVSGGNSANFNWFKSCKNIGEINNFRIGEAIFLGKETINYEPIPNLYTDAFRLITEIVELKQRSLIPKGIIVSNAFGESVQTYHKKINNGKKSDTIRTQALLNIGRQDIAVKGLNPKESINILGASSDYLVVDIRDNQFQIGQKLHFDLNYEALLRAMTSPYIHKKFIDI